MIHRCDSSSSGPVTVTFVRRVRSGLEADYERHVAALQDQAKEVRGYLGTSVIRDEGSREYLSIVRFDSIANLMEWEASGQRARWQRGLAGIVEGAATVRRAEGLEFWFTRARSMAKAPSSEKMAVVLVLVVWPLTLAIMPFAARYLAGVPAPLRTLASVVLQVVLMTYVIMPRVTAVLGGWLYPKD